MAKRIMARKHMAWLSLLSLFYLCQKKILNNLLFYFLLPELLPAFFLVTIDLARNSFKFQVFLKEGAIEAVIHKIQWQSTRKGKQQGHHLTRVAP